MAQLYSSSASFYYWFWYSFIFSPRLLLLLYVGWNQSRHFSFFLGLFYF
jgi:hypothetical protein